MVVCGLGGQKALKACRNACNCFIHLENLVAASVDMSDALAWLRLALIGVLMRRIA